MSIVMQVIQKNRDKFWSDNRSLNWKTLNYFGKVQNPYFSIYCRNSTQTTKLKPNQILFGRTYSNLTSLFWSKNIKVFQWLWKLKFLSFMTKVNPSNGNETKSDIFYEAFSNLTLFFITRKILKYFNNIYDWHRSISLQNSAQISKVKQNETEHVQIWPYFSLFRKWCTI